MSTLVPPLSTLLTVCNNHTWIQYLLQYTLKQLHTSNVHILQIYVSKHIHTCHSVTHMTPDMIHSVTVFHALSHIHNLTEAMIDHLQTYLSSTCQTDILRFQSQEWACIRRKRTVLFCPATAQIVDYIAQFHTCLHYGMNTWNVI
jgi:hypothetical protein